MAKAVLITGCSTGIGASLVHAFLKRNLIVFATARTPSSLSAFSKIPNVHCLALDVTSESSVAEAYEKVKARTGGRLDYLVNNAGIGKSLPALDHPIDEAKKMFETNFWGALRMVQVFSPLVIEAKGTIVNIGSVVGELPGPYGSIYNSSKAAVHMFSETLRLELAPLGVGVLTVVTAGVRTEILSKTENPVLLNDSRYKPVEKRLQAISRGESFKRMPSDQYAEQVVKDVLAGTTGKTWRGADASMAKFAHAFLPTWVIDRIMLEPSGLDKLKN